VPKRWPLTFLESLMGRRYRIWPPSRLQTQTTLTGLACGEPGHGRSLEFGQSCCSCTWSATKGGGPRLDKILEAKMDGELLVLTPRPSL